MSPNELRARLQGVIGFPVTPFNADLSLDLEGLRRNLRAMLRHPPRTASRVMPRRTIWASRQ